MREKTLAQSWPALHANRVNSIGIASQQSRGARFAIDSAAQILIASGPAIFHEAHLSAGEERDVFQYAFRAVEQLNRLSPRSIWQRQIITDIEFATRFR